MPDFPITDPATGRTLTVTGPSQPGPAAQAAIFADYAKQLAARTQAPPAENAAHIGPVTGSDTAPVTLADLIENPKLALQRMVSITKQGLSDPRNTIPAAIGLAAGATGLMPRSFASTRGMPTPTPPAPTGTPAPSGGMGIGQALRENVSLDDVVEAIPGAKTLKAGYRVAKGVVQAAKQVGQTPAAEAPTGSAAAPASTPGAAAPAPATPPAASPTATAPRTPPAAPKAARAASTGDLPSLADLQLTPAEITQAVKWHDTGVTPEIILHRILQSRQLTAKTRTETPDQAAFAIAERNRTGQWRD